MASEKNINENFRAGAKAMFDCVKYKAANSYHGDPIIQEQIDVENEIVERWIEEALEEVDEFAYDEWKSIAQLEAEKQELKIQLINVQQKLLKVMDK